MSPSDSFESLVLPHLDAGFNLARWLLREDASAEDAVQEAVLRALKYFGRLRGDNARPWFLAIVRNVCFNYLEARSGRAEQDGLEAQALDALQWDAGQRSRSPEEDLQGAQLRQQVDAALRALPPLLREVMVLREIEGLAYDEIARITGCPMGTVMSRLARARERIKTWLVQAGTR